MAFPGLVCRPWNSPYIWGSLALILVYAAYVAEIIRSGIDSIHGRRAATASLGLNEKDMRFVVLPQAIRNVAPANMNMFIALQDVALLSFIGPVEIFRQAGVYKSLMANFTPYVGAALIFLAVTIPATLRRLPDAEATQGGLSASWFCPGCASALAIMRFARVSI